MAKREQLFRLFDIIDAVKKNHHGTTYDQIYAYVESQHQMREDDFSDISFSKKTFKRDRDLIFDLFGIEFKFRKSTLTYQIDEDENLDHANQIYDNLLLVNAYRKPKMNPIFCFSRDGRLQVFIIWKA